MEIEETILQTDETTRRDLIRKISSGDFMLSHSSFNAFCESPKHFMDYKLKTFAPTPAMEFGEMIHCSILEPQEFENRYIVAPDVDKRTKEGKAEYEAFLLTVGGKKIVSARNFEASKAIGKSIRFNDAASWVLDKCTAFEVDIEWEYKGIKWRGRMDGDGRENGIILDLKVLADVSPRAVHNYVKYEGAGRQAVHYLRGGQGENCDYFILGVDKMGNCSVTKISKGVVNQISREIDYYIAQFKKCVFLGAWNQSYDFYSNTGFFEINSL